MKAEDVKRLFLNVRAKLGHGNLWWEYQDQALLTELARACEQHGIERAKKAAQPVIVRVTCMEDAACIEGWSALDAEIAKENEDG